MNVQTYLDTRYTGEVIGSRRVLAAMKRKGLISGYSEWCYLESHKVGISPTLGATHAPTISMWNSGKSRSRANWGLTRIPIRLPMLCGRLCRQGLASIIEVITLHRPI